MLQYNFIKYIIDNNERFDDYYKNHNSVVNIIQVLEKYNFELVYLNNLSKEHCFSNNGIYFKKYFNKEELMNIIEKYIYIKNEKYIK